MFCLKTDMLSTSSEKEVDMNLKLSINLSLYAIFLLSPSFLIDTEKVIYFPYFHQYNLVHL